MGRAERLEAEVSRLEGLVKDLRILYAERVMESQMHRIRAESAEKEVRKLKGEIHVIETRDHSIR